MRPEDHWPRLLRWHEISLAPDRCGLYAWYYVPRISAANVTTKADTTACLVRAAQQLRFPDLTVDLKGHLNLRFDGRIEHQHMGQEPLDRLLTVERILDNESARSSLAELLEMTAPGFSAPLYIGVSKNLRGRLSQHASIIDDIVVDQGAVDGETAAARDQCFGKEIRHRNIDPNTLAAYVCPTSDSPGIDARGFVEGVESILNRLYFPIFGKR